MLEVNIQKTINKLTSKRKTAKARINAKKSDNTALSCLRETREWNMCFGPRNSKIVYQNSRLSTIPTFNMIKGVIDMTIEKKYLEHHQKSVNSKHNRCLSTCLEN